MHAAASLPAIAPTLARPHQTPLVLVDGALEPRLTLTYATIEGPLDRRRLTLVSDGTAPAGTQHHWQRSEVALALPQRLHDDQLRRPVLAVGHLQRISDNRSAGQVRQQFTLIDHWRRLLDKPPATIPSVDANGRLIAQPEGAFNLGARANRSSQRYQLAGRGVHALQRNGEPWTVGDTLETLAAAAHLDLSLVAIPPAIARTPLRASLNLDQPVGRLLEQVLEAHGLLIQRSLDRLAGRLRERRAVRPLASGRPVTVRRPEAAQPLGDVLRIDADAPRQAAQQWIAESSPWLVESTFALVPGWDPTREGRSDAAYGRTTSNDFSRYANVYRQWVLNEDGGFTGPPYHQGEPFDLTSFFEETDKPLAPQPLSLQHCLALDDAGDRLEPIIEVSTDGGASWSRYGGEAIVLTARAGVYLDDATLPTAFLDAAKAGAGRVRVTGSLQSPHPVRLDRWRGNPFAGRRPPRVLDGTEGFRFQRVAAASIHRPAIDAGALQAAEIDQRPALSAWLIARLSRAEAAAHESNGRAGLTLAGGWPMLRPGDQLHQAGGPGRTLRDTSQALSQGGAIVHALTIHFPIAHGQGPSTRLQLRY